MASKQPEEKLQYDDFLGWTVSSLKDYLALRGLAQTGRRVELVARAFSAHELHLPKKFSQEEIYAKIKSEYSKRLASNGICDPNSLPNDAWCDDVLQWPHVDDGKLFSYILRVKAVDVDYIGRYKNQKAYSYWMSGNVDVIQLAKCPMNSKCVFLKCEVSPSQKIHDDPHKVWVCIEGKSDCKIITSWCTCIAGTGEVCNHVIAMLYKVNFAYNKNYVSPACTSIPQGWNKGTKKDVKPGKIKDLTFRRDQRTKKKTARNPELDQTLRKLFDPRKPDDRIIDDEKASIFLDDLKNILPSACFLYSLEHGHDTNLPLPLSFQASEFMSDANLKCKPLEEVVPLFIQHIEMSPEQVKNIEVHTRGQNTNDEWKKQRVGRITASKFHEIATKTETIVKQRGKKKARYSPLVFDILNKSKDISNLPAIAWGQQHEKDGIKSFMSDVASQHENGLQGFNQCGLFIKQEYPYLAASPDGMFNCNCCGTSTIEVKCPYSVRKDNINEKSVYDKVEFLEEHEGEPRLKRSHKYYTQVQAQMWACNVKQCFFIVWTEGHRALYEKIIFDKVFCQQIINNLNIFYKAYVLPCLLGYKDMYLCAKCEKVILEEAEINNQSLEKSILCSSCGTWWHLPCAGLTLSYEFVESWICSSCLVDVRNILDDVDFRDDTSESDGDQGEISQSQAMEYKELEAVGASSLTAHEGSTSSAPNSNICSVCLLESIPVGTEHICSICRNAVHAWCSNHEEITDSSDLKCNYCAE